ncbi:MAG TPA: CPBP family glutamic-type intramembrane protease [Thermoplasmata archaeon]|nr:CPBP family glutamic-type intramembrane protease [Thermoplasmata archaeon]
MERVGESWGAARGSFGFGDAHPGGSFGWVLAGFVGAYALAGTLLALSLAGLGDFLVPGMAFLVLLCVGVFAGSLLDARRTAQRFYLALSLVPSLSIARLAFLGVSVPIFDPLFVYLLFAVALLAFRQSTGSGQAPGRMSRRQVPRALILGSGLAAAFAILGVVLPLASGPVTPLPLWMSLPILAPIALLDELWFRGFLQQGLAGATTARQGWLATAVLFVAYGAPFGTPTVLLFRAAFGVTLGALAMRPVNLPAALVARTVMAVALVALAPGLSGASLIV